MKPTGIVRRIDDLGRIVIPREIRRTLRMKEGDALELFMDGTNGVYFKKYSPIKCLSDFIEGYSQVISEATGHTVCIADTDNIIAVSGTPKKGLINKRISSDIENVIDKKFSLMRNVKNGDTMISVIEEQENLQAYCSCIVVPIIAEGDSIGAIIVLTGTDIELGEFDIKFAKATAKLIENQVVL